MLKSSAAPSLNVLISNGEICRSVRSKKLFYQHEEESDARSAAPFWCSRTQSTVGPDGKLVGLDECRSSRACCQTA